MMGRIRPFVTEDIPSVVDLRGRAFEFSEHSTRDGLAAYFENLFFRNPWQDERFPSLVHEEGDGRVTGFLGVMRRPATFRGEPIDVAVCTQFMVDPAHRGLAGVQLVRRLFQGPQQLTIADVANDLSRSIWEGLGGTISPVHSLTWTQPLRRLRFKAAEHATDLITRGIARLLRPVISAFDAGTTRWPAPAGLTQAPLTPEIMAKSGETILAGTALRPSYDAESARWLVNQLASKRDLGGLGGTSLLDSQRRVAGWYLYYINRGGVGEVVQVLARQDDYAVTLQSLFHEAWANGLIALTGRGDPRLLPALDPRRVRVSRSGPWMLVQSKRGDILDAIARGDAFFSRLEGEWWMNF